MARKPKPRRSRWATEAQLQSLLRFGPEESGLRELQRTAEDTYKQTVATQRGAGESIINAIDSAKPQVAGLYDEAGLRQAGTASLLQSQTQGLGNVTDPIKAAIYGEQAVGGRHLTESRASALSDLASRRVAAREGVTYAQNAAQRKLTTDLTKVLERKADLQREKGAFTALTEGQLQDAARERALKVRIKNAELTQSDINSQRTAETSRLNNIRTTRTSRENARLRARGKTTATGEKLLTPQKHLEYQNAIQEIGQHARRYRGKLSRRQIVEKLATGRGVRSGYALPDGTPVDKNTPGARPYKLDAIKAYPADLRMRAALDMSLDGHISPKTQKLLEHAGFSIKQLGLTTRRQWEKRRAPGIRRTQSRYGPNG